MRFTWKSKRNELRATGSTPVRGGVLRALSGDAAGNVLAIGAAGFMVLAALIGGGVDISRAYMVKSRLQGACDAGTLAGRRAITTNGFDENAKAEAREYFDNNFIDAARDTQSTSFVLTSDDTGSVVNGSASTQVNTILMKIFGKMSITVTATCTASMGVGNSDVTLVLDTTGSMADPITAGGGSKISLLRAAMIDFYKTVQASTSNSNARVRYSFVPYSSAVNVGRLLYDLNPSYLADAWVIQSRKPIYRTVTVQVLDHYGDPVVTNSSSTSSSTTVASGDYNSTQYTTSNNCTSALPADTAWTNYGSATTVGPDTTINAKKEQVTTTTTTQPQRKTDYECVQRSTGNGKNKKTFYIQTYATLERDSSATRTETRAPVYRTEEESVFDHYQYEAIGDDADEANLLDWARYKTFSSVSTVTGTNGASVSTTWDGCIEERQSSAASTFTYSSLTNTISPSAATDLDIDSAPGSSNASKWKPMWRGIAYYRTNSDGSLTNAASLYGRSASSYCPSAAQLLRTMSESEFTTYANSLKAEGSTYHDYGILWGARLASPTGLFSSNVNLPADNGAEVSRHMIFMTDGKLEPSNLVQSTHGIEFHDRRVTSDGSTSITSRHRSRFLALCEATKARGIRLWVIAFSTGLTTDLETCASDNSAFTADDADELNQAFQEIAKQVGELRITQ